MVDYPSMIAPVDHVEPVPRRVRAYLAGQLVLDTLRARYVWEWAGYPQFYIPLADVRSEFLVDERATEQTGRGEVRIFGLRVGEEHRPQAARVLDHATVAGLDGTVRFRWDALDAWFEESEEVFVHPRNPYSRVDALRSTREVHVAVEGITLARSRSPVMVFETGLPTRYYLDRTDVRMDRLVPSETVTACPYKGRTSGYWSVRTDAGLHRDLAWSYDFPTADLRPIAGLIAFYNERVDITVDGVAIERPVTHFTPRRDGGRPGA